MNIKETLLAWIDQSDHYEFDLYGEMVKVDLPKETVKKVLDISILLVDRVVAAKGELHSSDYPHLEGDNLIQVVFSTVLDEHLFGKYKDIEPMIGELHPRDFPMGSASYLLMVRPEMYKLIYAVISQVDIVKENYDGFVQTFFLGVLAMGWGEGFGWRKENGVWTWRKRETV